MCDREASAPPQLLINPDLYREDAVIQCKVQPYRLWGRRDEPDARARVPVPVPARGCR